MGYEQCRYDGLEKPLEELPKPTEYRWGLSLDGVPKTIKKIVEEYHRNPL